MYAGSCNPSRRAKRLRSDSTSESTQLLPPETLPSPIPSPIFHLQIPTKRHQARGTSVVDRPNADDGDIVVPAPPALQKRGRKSGLPRAAREAQRKLNHSMIEKARRTKINEALAALRAMVPVDYGSQAKEVGDDDDEDRTGNGEEWSPKDKGKPKEKGKREEKEKEFKLEILVRTVSFMQDLLVKVRDMEAAGNNVCPNCQGQLSSGMKRKRSSGFVQALEDGPAPSTQEDFNMTVESHVRANKDDDGTTCRLPSISSWLPPQTDPSCLPSFSPRTDGMSYLPSPPSSAPSRPTSTTRLPPTLALDAPNTPIQPLGANPNVRFRSGSTLRSPEDESAASLLLQISISSPPWSPSSTASANAPLLDLARTTQTRSVGSMGQRQSPETSVIQQAQTPSSMLGMRV